MQAHFQSRFCMYEFYKKALIGCFCLLVASLLLGYLCLKESYLHLSLLPAAESPLAWHAVPNWDARPGGPATLRVEEDRQLLRYQFRVSNQIEHPYVATDLTFLDQKGKPIHADLSRYTTISMRVSCSPANTLQLSVPTYEGGAKHDDFLNYRTPLGFFSCNERPSHAELDLTRLETPQWWFYLVKQDLSHQAYKLDKVPRISFGTTFQSPLDVTSTVEISELELRGRDRRYLVLLVVVLGLAWGGFGLWFFQQHARALVTDVQGKLQKDLPFVAYQQLSLEPHRDKEKTAILQFLANKYADAELDLETVVEQTGVNRNKISEVLKNEFGFTFSGYVNKLRLTEAARLLAEKDTATVAEIAYSVGYSNISYFNKLFKEEYGCTPKAFRIACKG